MLSGLRTNLSLNARADAVEMLDSGDLSPTEVERNLADLARLNRLPGGTAASIAGIERLVGPMISLRILDVGTGGGDIPLAFGRRGWSTVAVDSNPEVLAVAMRRTVAEPAIELVAADARALPFDDGAFDVAHCSLLLHHLDPHDAVRTLRELGRVSTRGVVINDLRRGVLPLVATWAGVMAFGRSRVTRHDGLISARRAYTLEELDTLIARAGLVRRWRSNRWTPRITTAAVAP
jgi:SAM-dependent methyltransferase